MHTGAQAEANLLLAWQTLQVEHVLQCSAVQCSADDIVKT